MDHNTLDSLFNNDADSDKPGHVEKPQNPFSTNDKEELSQEEAVKKMAEHGLKDEQLAEVLEEMGHLSRLSWDVDAKESLQKWLKTVREFIKRVGLPRLCQMYYDGSLERVPGELNDANLMKATVAMVLGMYSIEVFDSVSGDPLADGGGK